MIQDIYASNPSSFVDRVLLEYRSKKEEEKQDFVAALAQTIREMKVRKGGK